MHLQDAQRIIIKIGSALLVGEENGVFHSAWLTSLVQDIASLYNQGKDIIIVTSGSIALGCKQLSLPRQHLKLETKQALAAIGQPQLIQQYQTHLQKHDIQAAQLLLNIEDSENRRRYINARSTIETLLEMGIIPIINENDSVATDEIRFSDNDVLAARVAQMVSADTLILLSDVDGLYDKDPSLNKDAQWIAEITDITPEIEAMGGESASKVGTGGMASKIAAAKIAVGSGCHLVIAKGSIKHPVQAILDGKRCSWFISKESPLSSRKYWIATSLNTNGSITIDQGATKALKEGNSLLAIGVSAIEGQFERGDAVLVKDQSGNILGKGLSAYNTSDAERIKGKHSDDFEAILGFEGRKELIHRDDFVLET